MRSDRETGLSITPTGAENLSPVALAAALAEAQRELAEARRELAETRREQTATADVLKVISRSAFDLDAVLATLTESARRLCGADVGTVHMRDGSLMRLRAESACPSEFVAWLAANPIDPRTGRGARTHVGVAVLTGATAEVADVESSPDLRLGDAPRLGRFRAVVGVPMLRDGVVEGVFSLGRRAPGAFDPRHVELLQSFADQAMIAVENARLFHEVQARTRDLEESLAQQTAAAEVLKVISRSAFDLDPVLRTLVQSARRLCNGEIASISIIEDGFLRFRALDGGDPAFEAFLRANPFPVADPSPANNAGRVLMTGEASYIRDVEAEPGYAFGEAPRLGRFRSLLGAPLLREGRVIGVFQIGAAAPDALTPRQIALVGAFADQAVVAIENARLMDEVRAKTGILEEALDRQRASADILHVISASPTDPAPVFDRIVATAARLMRCDYAYVLLADGDRWRAAAGATSGGAPAEWLPNACPVDPEADFPSRAIVSKAMVHAPDWSLVELPRLEREVRETIGAQSSLYLPLLREGACVGVLGLASRRTHAFGPDEIAQAESFRDQALIAIENARLFGETQEALRQQTATAQVLQTISRSVFDLDTVLRTLIDTAVRLCRGSRGTIFIRNGDRLEGRGFHSNVPEGMRSFILANPQPLVAEHAIALTVREGRVFHSADLASNPALIPAGAREHAAFGALLCVPLMREGEAIGCFAVPRDEPLAFTDREIGLVATFADQAVIAIENARLFGEVQAKTRDLEESLAQQTATAEVLKVISRSPANLQPVLDAIADTAARLCGSDMTMFFRFDGRVFRILSSWNFPDDGRAMLEAAAPEPGHPSALGRAGATLRPAYIPDVLAEPGYALRTEQDRALYRATLAVPMLSEGKLVGALSLNRAEPGSFTAKHIELVSTFADQAAIAFENVRLFNETQARTRDLEEALSQQTATADVLKVISRSAFDLQSVFDTLVASAYRLCGAMMGLLYVRDGDDFACTAIATEGFETEAADRLFKNRPIRAGRGTAAERVIASGRVEWVEDYFADREASPAVREVIRDLSERGGGFGRVRSALAVPMKRDGEVVGVIAIASPQTGPFPQRQIELLQTFADQAVIAIENARLFEEVQAKTRDLEESLERQTATSTILEVIASSPADAAPVFEAIAASANAVMRGRSTGVYRFVGDRAHLMAMTSTSPEGDAALRATFPLALADFPLFQRFSEGYSQIADTEAAADLRIRDLGRARGYRSILLAPLLQHGRPVGLISVTREEVGGFAPADIAQLRAFADQAVIAIENARLFEEVKARTRDLEESLAQQTATADVLKVISRSTFDLEAVLTVLVESARNLCDATQSMVLLSDGSSLRMAKQVGLPDAFERYVRDHPAAIGPTSGAGRAVQQRQVVHYPDVLADDAYGYGEGQKVGGYRALLSVPLLRGEEAIGVFCLGRPTPGAFTERQIELVRTFADQAVIAIENARLFGEVQAKTRDLEESLAQQTATADVLKVISRSAFDLDPVFATLIERAARLCGANRGTIFLREGDALVPAALHGMPEGTREALVANPLRVDESSAGGRAVLTREVCLIPDVAADPAYRRRDLASVGQYRSIIGVPLLQDGEAIGAFSLPRAEPGGFTPRQIETLKTFADQAVIAIGNARLFNEVQARTKELAQSLDDLRRAQDRLIQSEKLASLGQLTAGIAHEIKNPLNFVNNFSALSRELLAELRETLDKAELAGEAREEADELVGMIDQNLDKVVAHGKRADSIVKNMLLHSREGSGERGPVAVNAMVEEALNLAYHGARAEKAGFNVTIEKALDPAAGEAELYPQEMTRVLLNLISNGFYATTKRGQGGAPPGWEPTIFASTRDLGHSVEIVVRDNGTGIPDDVKARMFNPFFTTKPAGEGTGLGLSLSHDIVVKQHGGAIEVATEPGVFTAFTITLPRRGAAR